MNNATDPTTIRLLRLVRRMTQSDLAELLGVGQPHVSRIENSQRAVSARVRQELAKHLGTKERRP